MHVKDAIASKQNVTLWANQARNQGGGNWSICLPLKFSKHSIAILTFAETCK